MAKKKKTRKGYSELDEYKKSLGVTEESSVPNFKQLAEEFQKLLNKRYIAKLNNGQIIKFTFQEGNFYHLLGFHKFKKTIFEAMIKDMTIDYTPSDFYKDVQDGNIKYSNIDTSKIKISSKMKVSDYQKYDEHERTSEIKDVLNRRFPYFTYENIISILRNKVVINFEKDLHSGEIRADKIFFCFLDITQRNLNLFLDSKDGEYFTTSFFLENIKDSYKKKIDGTDMEMLDVLSMYIVDEEKHSEIEFYVNWSSVTSYVLDNGEYPEYWDMKKMYNKKDITVSFIKEQLDKLLHKLNEEENKLELIDQERTLKETIMNYIKAETKEEKEIFQLKLMDYDIDIENEDYDEEFLDKEIKRLISDMKEIKELSKRIQKKILKTKEAIPKIQNYEIQKIKEVYQPLIEKSEFWNSDFWVFLSEKYDLFNMVVSPREVKSYYEDWKLNRV